MESPCLICGQNEVGYHLRDRRILRKTLSPMTEEIDQTPVKSTPSKSRRSVGSARSVSKSQRSTRRSAAHTLTTTTSEHHHHDSHGHQGHSHSHHSAGGHSHGGGGHSHGQVTASTTTTTTKSKKSDVVVQPRTSTPVAVVAASSISTRNSGDQSSSGTSQQKQSTVETVTSSSSAAAASSSSPSSAAVSTVSKATSLAASTVQTLITQVSNISLKRKNTEVLLEDNYDKSPKTDYTYAHSISYSDRSPEHYISPNMSRRRLRQDNLQTISSLSRTSQEMSSSFLDYQDQSQSQGQSQARQTRRSRSQGRSATAILSPSQESSLSGSASGHQMRLRGGGSSAATVTRKTTTTTTTTSYDDDIEFEKQAAYENDSNSRTESSIINHLYGLDHTDNESDTEISYSKTGNRYASNGVGVRVTSRVTSFFQTIITTITMLLTSSFSKSMLALGSPLYRLITRVVLFDVWLLSRVRERRKKGLACLCCCLPLLLIPLLLAGGTYYAYENDLLRGVGGGLWGSSVVKKEGAGAGGVAGGSAAAAGGGGVTGKGGAFIGGATGKEGGSGAAGAAAGAAAVAAAGGVIGCGGISEEEWSKRIQMMVLNIYNNQKSEQLSKMEVEALVRSTVRTEMDALALKTEAQRSSDLAAQLLAQNEAKDQISALQNQVLAILNKSEALQLELAAAKAGMKMQGETDSAGAAAAAAAAATAAANTASAAATARNIAQLEDQIGSLRADISSIHLAHGAFAAQMRNCCKNETVLGAAIHTQLQEALAALMAGGSGAGIAGVATGGKGMQGFSEWLQAQFASKDSLDQRLALLADRLSKDMMAVQRTAEDKSAAAAAAAAAATAAATAAAATAAAGHEANSNSKTVYISQNNITALTQEQVQRMIKEALFIFGADKTGMPDFALESSGGSVISTRCSETYHRRTAEFSLFGVPLWYASNSPRTVIQPDVQPGQCWAFKGSLGYVIIQLSAKVQPTAFSLEHLPKALAPSGNIDSAPKDFEVYGLENEKDTKGTFIGNYTYDESGPPLQYFPVAEPDKIDAFNIVELRITSNWGNLEYTCLYRFRVHGTPQRR